MFASGHVDTAHLVPQVSTDMIFPHYVIFQKNGNWKIKSPALNLILLNECAVGRLRLRTSQGARQAGDYPGFGSMKRPEESWFLLLDAMLVHRGVTHSPLFGRCPFIHLGGERHCERKVSCPRKQHNVPGQGLKIRPREHWQRGHRAVATHIINWSWWILNSCFFGTICSNIF